MSVKGPIWHRSEERFLFHHTTAEAAESIAGSGQFRVGQGALLGPTGIYAGSDDPASVSLEWVRRTYFFDLWPVEALGGVVVFRGDDELQPFTHQAASTWVLPAPVGWLDVLDVVVGWGALDPHGDWSWSPGLGA